MHILHTFFHPSMLTVVFPCKYLAHNCIAAGTYAYHLLVRASTICSLMATIHTPHKLDRSARPTSALLSCSLKTPFSHSNLYAGIALALGQNPCLQSCDDQLPLNQPSLQIAVTAYKAHMHNGSCDIN